MRRWVSNKTTTNRHLRSIEVLYKYSVEVLYKYNVEV